MHLTLMCLTLRGCDLQTVNPAHDLQLCAEGLCSAFLPPESEHFEPCFCACHRRGVVIDGCFVPLEVYERVKALARKVGRTQFIGVVYNQPAELQTVGGGWDWVGIMRRDSARRQHMKCGQHLVYILDQSRDELMGRSDVAMVLWITSLD